MVGEGGLQHARKTEGGENCSPCYGREQRKLNLSIEHCTEPTDKRIGKEQRKICQREVRGIEEAAIFGTAVTAKDGRSRRDGQPVSDAEQRSEHEQSLETRNLSPHEHETG